MALNKVFLDTNIILDVLCQRTDCKTAATILNMGATREIELYITNLTVSNAFYIARRELGSEQALSKIRTLCSFINIAPCGQEEANKAFDIPSPDIEDALQYFSALSSGAECIITRNLKHFKYSSVPVYDSISFLNSYTNKPT